MLLIFDFGYTLLRLITRNRRKSRMRNRKTPGVAAAGIRIIGLAGISFLLRINIPMGFTIPVLGFPTFAYFPQYLAFFILGMAAYKRDWFNTLPDRLGIIGFGIAAAASVFLFPLALTGNMFSLQLNASSRNFLGNGSFQSAVYALWDSAFSVGICCALLVLFRALFKRQGSLVRSASAASYGVYILHVLVIVFFAVMLRNVELAPLFKFIIVSAAAVICSFTLSLILRRIPGVARII
jgi:surface polysaccharide O-acyltransferase-like enzyme